VSYDMRWNYIKVKVVNSKYSNAWYSNHIGEVFDVEKYPHKLDRLKKRHALAKTNLNFQQFRRLRLNQEYMVNHCCILDEDFVELESPSKDDKVYLLRKEIN
jgi:hypothetical protein